MNPIGIAGIVVLLILLAMGMPIAYAMLLVGVVGSTIIIGAMPTLSSVQNALYYAAANWLFVCIPMFILMGHFANRSEIMKDIFRFFNVWLGWLPGSLALVTIMSSAMFAFATGSSLAATAVMGKMTLPEMDRYKYARKISLGSIVAGGSLGNLIPPSIGLVLFGMITQQSVGRLLLAAVLPGIMITVMFMLLILIMILKNPHYAPKGSSSTWAERRRSIKNVWGIIVLVILVLGSIFTGMATVTEASSVGAFGAFVIFLLRGKFTFRTFWEILKETAETTTMIFLLIATVDLFSRFLTFSGVTRGLVDLLVTSGNLPPSIVIILVFGILFIAGCALDPASLMLVFTPILFPIMQGVGYDPILFGVMTIIMIEVGLMTPPVGLCVYVLKVVSDASLEEIFKAVFPFVCVWLLGVIILNYFPMIALFLPNIMR